MSKICKFLILPILILTNINIAFGQKELTVKEFWDLYYAAERKLEKITYRRSSESTTVRDEQKYGRKEIYEFIPPDKSRAVSENNTLVGTEREEWINIGKKYYLKKDNDKWQKITDFNADASTDNPSRTTEEKKVIGDEKISSNSSFMYVGKTALNGENVDEYAFNSTNAFATTKIIYFINDKNLLAKRTDYMKIGNLIRQSSETYEYDLKIKIEAPVK